MWRFCQDTGALFFETRGLWLRAATGYAGFGEGRNNPDMQHVEGIGPIPVGVYTIEAPVDTGTHGPFVLPLTPNPGNEMFGRSSFLIHGDSNKHPGDFIASRGCIVLRRMVRETIWSSGDHVLGVVRTFA